MHTKMKMEAFYKTHAYLIEHANYPVRRPLMDEIDPSDHLICIKGPRGVGKTTFLLQYAKEKYGTDTRCLYLNMNNFYFQIHGISEFAAEFHKMGGRVLLIDKIFKHPNWGNELRYCYENFPDLQIIFTCSSVTKFKQDVPEIAGIVKSYHLRGFSFREFLNLQTGNNFRSYTLDEIENHHEELVKEILPYVRPLNFFQSYLHHGFYPISLEKSNFALSLLKTINMMMEVDILLIKQIELKYLTKIKKLLYLLAVDGPGVPNVSQLAKDINTSRATVMKYIKYLCDARLINMVYPKGEKYPKKPYKVMLHNTNLMYSFYPLRIEEQDVWETFFLNTLWKDHKLNKGLKGSTFLVDEEKNYRVCGAGANIRKRPGVTYATFGTEVGHGKQIPLWLFGFLY